MKNINIKSFLKDRITGNILILVTSIVLIYMSISIYFVNHFFWGTKINGVNVSLKSHKEVSSIILEEVKNYKLELIGRDGSVEEIKGNDIEIKYNEKNTILKVKEVKEKQNSLKWIIGLIKRQEYYGNDLVIYNQDLLEDKIKNLKILNENIIEPQNVNFKYLDGEYEIVEEVYGNKINIDRLSENIKLSISEGKRVLNLNDSFCYEDPKYTINSDKTIETQNTLNKYVSTKITYTFGSKSEVLDGSKINEWLSVDDNLEASIDEKKVKDYILYLCEKYNTAGTTRKFKSATGKIVDVKGGHYGWKINSVAETKLLMENIKLGAVLEKEPAYTQKALYRDENDIGNTYVEINITRQHVWFYKDGKLITQGDVVTGDPNKGFSTQLGTYMLNYKQKEATLSGANYEAKVVYWMPFNGNIGIHDASWRYSFGGNIYKNNGTHGCVNSPSYLAKTIFENIEPGTPIICYEE